MTDEELAAIEARANAALPGPWGWDGVEAPYDDALVCFCTLKSYGSFFPFSAHTRKDDKVGSICADGVPGYEPENVLEAEGDVIIGREPTLAFIAHARTDVPALIAEVKRLQAENGRLKDYAPFWALEPTTPLPAAPDPASPPT